LNHLAELFTRHGLRFTPQARTEASNQPDSFFSGEREYHDAAFNAALLVMLGVKSTSKDRWRQVLTEADRIPQKHLCTLEAGISAKQTDEMRRQQLTLVVPTGLHGGATVGHVECDGIRGVRPAEANRMKPRENTKNTEEDAIPHHKPSPPAPPSDGRGWRRTFPDSGAEREKRNGAGFTTGCTRTSRMKWNGGWHWPPTLESLRRTGARLCEPQHFRNE
jgi:hypothetical protein